MRDPLPILIHSVPFDRVITTDEFAAIVDAVDEVVDEAIAKGADVEDLDFSCVPTSEALHSSSHGEALNRAGLSKGSTVQVTWRGKDSRLLVRHLVDGAIRNTVLTYRSRAKDTSTPE